MPGRPHPAARSRRAVAVASVGALTVLGATMAVDGLLHRSSTSDARPTTDSTSGSERDRVTGPTTTVRRSATPSTTVPRSSSRPRTKAS